MSSNPKVKDCKKYAVFVVRLKDKFVKNKQKENSNFPWLHILVRKYEKYQRACEAPSKKQQKEILNLKKRFRGLVVSDGFSLFENKADAYRAAYKKVDSLNKAKRIAKIHADSDSNKCRVYCIRLTPSVWRDENTFRKRNDHINGKKIKRWDSSIHAYYVGQTGQEIEERYKQHMSLDPEESNSTKWGKKYFIKKFDEAFDLQLIQAFEAETGKSTTDLLYGKSIIMEHELTDWIRKKGMGAYCA